MPVIGVIRGKPRMPNTFLPDVMHLLNSEEISLRIMNLMIYQRSQTANLADSFPNLTIDGSHITRNQRILMPGNPKTQARMGH